MPYVVLARRWRPQLFSDVVGQDHVTTTLQNAISSGRIAHAYLFTGPRGVGKTTVARVFAKAVNCKDNSRSEPCNECNSCVEISSGRSIDVIEIDAASNRGIDEIRELRESVRFAPVSGKYKVYIIDESHMLTIEAFNALLKTLEEPPAHVIFILATTEPHKIPATILSRCQRFDFRMLTRKEIIGRLKELLKADNIPADEEALSIIADSADGAMRDAESIMDQLLSFGDGKLIADEASRFLGLGSYHLLGQLVEKILEGNGAKSLETLGELADHGTDLSQFLKKLVSYFRDLIVYKINPSLIEESETKLQKLADQAKNASDERLMKIVKILTQTESDIKQLGYERLNLEIALVKVCKLKEASIPLDRVLGKLEEIESKLSSGMIEIAKPATVEADTTYDEAVVEIVETETHDEVHDESDPLKSVWSRLLVAIKDNNISLQAMLREATPLSIEDGALTIDFDAGKYGWHREQVQEADNKKQIEAELSKIVGKPMKIKVGSDESSKDNGNTKEDIPRSQRDMRLDAMKDETIQLVLNVFDGRIVEVKR